MSQKQMFYSNQAIGQLQKRGKEAEKRLNLKQILGYHQWQRAGFGSISFLKVPPKITSINGTRS